MRVFTFINGLFLTLKLGTSSAWKENLIYQLPFCGVVLMLPKETAGSGTQTSTEWKYLKISQMMFKYIHIFFYL